MRFFREMDIYKLIILLSLVLMPVCGWWISGLNDEIMLCTAAKRAATKRGGYLEEIGKLKNQIEVVAQNRRSESIENPSAYFEPRIRAADPQLRVDDFSPKLREYLRKNLAAEVEAYDAAKAIAGERRENDNRFM